jgi:hypothetical protein
MGIQMPGVVIAFRFEGDMLVAAQVLIKKGMGSL